MQVELATGDRDFEHRESQDVHDGLHHGGGIVVGRHIDGREEEPEFLDDETLAGRELARVGHVGFLLGLGHGPERAPDGGREEAGLGASGRGLEQDFVVEHVFQHVAGNLAVGTGLDRLEVVGNGLGRCAHNEILSSYASRIAFVPIAGFFENPTVTATLR